MKPVYYPYWKWEDYKNGMFHKNKANGSYQLSAKLLCDFMNLYLSMRYVAFNWKYSAEMNLSNRSRNRQAWLGQASCCYKMNVCEENTKIAWGSISNKKRLIANEVADIVIDEWESWYTYYGYGQLGLINNGMPEQLNKKELIDKIKNI